MHDAKRALPWATADALEISFHDDAPRHNANAELDQARDRVDKSIKLLAWSLDLRELLWLGLDLEEMTDEVGDLKRAVASHKRRTA